MRHHIQPQRHQHRQSTCNHRRACHARASDMHHSFRFVKRAATRNPQGRGGWKCRNCPILPWPGRVNGFDPRAGSGDQARRSMPRGALPGARGGPRRRSSAMAISVKRSPRGRRVVGLHAHDPARSSVASCSRNRRAPPVHRGHLLLPPRPGRDRSMVAPRGGVPAQPRRRGRERRGRGRNLHGRILRGGRAPAPPIGGFRPGLKQCARRRLEQCRPKPWRRDAASPTASVNACFQTGRHFPGCSRVLSHCP